jgi:hypothetical protein
MTTSTHSHKAWTDKGGHVNRIGADVARVHVLDAQMKLSSDIWLTASAPG